MCDHLAYCERNELKAENDRLSAELAEAQKAVEIALSERVNLRAAMNNEIYRLRAELAEARRALLAGNDTVLANKKLQEDNAAKDRIIANLNERERIATYWQPMAEAWQRDAETLRKRVAELEEREQNHIEVANRRLARAERAEAELKAMRELLDWIYGFLAYVDSYHSRMIRDKVRAALNRSPPD